MNELTAEEIKAIRYSIGSSIDLYKGYIKLNPEDTRMKRKQAITAKRLALLRSAYKKLK